MLRNIGTVLTCLALALRHATAAPTWPSSVDELEDIMLVNTGYRARGFAAPVIPCSASLGPGRFTSAEWLRTAFHDMAPGSIFTGRGGLDASIGFELGGDNPGPGFPSTLNSFAPFLTSQSSMADLIAMGVYASVRSCGGPVVPIRTGRTDAEGAGPPGVPQPQNSLFTFQNQFARMGFSTTEMIAVVACGHTMGGVHTANFPQIVPAGTSPNNFKRFDPTDAFDQRIASDYVTGQSADPLVAGPCSASGRCSDDRVFKSDANVTIAAMANPATFQSRCQTLLQKMIDVVPSTVVLTDPIVPYEVKPVAIQLTLLAGGSSLTFSGEIRVRTTARQVASVQLVYSGGTVSTTLKGAAAGLDDSFAVSAYEALPLTGDGY